MFSAFNVSKIIYASAMLSGDTTRANSKNPMATIT